MARVIGLMELPWCVVEIPEVVNKEDTWNVDVLELVILQWL